MTMSAITQPGSVFQFLRLPDVARLMVYDYSFQGEDRFSPRLSTISRQVRKECLLQYFKQTWLS